MGVKTYHVSGVPEKFSTVIEKSEELYFPIEAFNLTVLDVLALINDVGGDILVGASKANGQSGVLVSEIAIGSGLISQGFVLADEFSKMVIEIREKIEGLEGLEQTKGTENNGTT